MSYMAPEQLSSTNVNRRADVYAAGVVLWEALTGRRLFRADTEAETLNLVLHGVVPAPSTVAPEIVPEIDAVLRKALERDPDKRFQSAAEFADALENLECVKVATSRAVSTYINDLLAEPINKRRELIRKFNESGAALPAHGDQSGVRPASRSTPSRTADRHQHHAAPWPTAASRAPVGMMPDGGAVSLAPPALEAQPSQRRTGLYVVIAAALLVLFGSVFVAVFSMRAPPLRPTTRRAPTLPRPRAAPRGRPSRSPRPSTQPAVVAQPEAPVAQPAVPSRSPKRPTRSPKRRPTRFRGRAAAVVRRAQDTAPAHPASAPPTPTPALPPAQTQAGPGEFRPSGI